MPFVPKRILRNQSRETMAWGCIPLEIYYFTVYAVMILIIFWGWKLYRCSHDRTVINLPVTFNYNIDDANLSSGKLLVRIEFKGEVDGVSTEKLLYEEMNYAVISQRTTSHWNFYYFPTDPRRTLYGADEIVCGDYVMGLLGLILYIFPAINQLCDS